MKILSTSEQKAGPSDSVTGRVLLFMSIQMKCNLSMMMKSHSTSIETYYTYQLKEKKIKYRAYEINIHVGSTLTHTHTLYLLTNFLSGYKVVHSCLVILCMYIFHYVFVRYSCSNLISVVCDIVFFLHILSLCFLFISYHRFLFCHFLYAPLLLHSIPFHSIFFICTHICVCLCVLLDER